MSALTGTAATMVRPRHPYHTTNPDVVPKTYKQCLQLLDSLFKDDHIKFKAQLEYESLVMQEHEDFETFMARYDTVLLNAGEDFVASEKKALDFRKKLTESLRKAVIRFEKPAEGDFDA